MTPCFGVGMEYMGDDAQFLGPSCEVGRAPWTPVTWIAMVTLTGISTSSRRRHAVKPPLRRGQARLFPPALISDRALPRPSRVGPLDLLVAALISGFLLAGCGGSPQTISPPDSARETPDTSRPTTGTSALGTSTTEPTSKWTSEQQGVIDAYGRAMSAFDQATADPPNPDSPALLATTIDPVLAEVRNLASSWKGFGQALRYPANSAHRIDALSVEVVGNTATIETCNVDDGVLYEPATGKVLNDKVTTAHDKATMTLVDGSWKLATRAQLEKWEGVAGCAVATS